MAPWNDAPATHDEARALANPLRLRILRLCLDRAMTNEELAARAGPQRRARCSTTCGCSSRPGSSRPRASGAGARGAIERPYRATGKSWTLDVGEEEGSGKTNVGTLALIDAFRAEVAESPPDVPGDRVAPGRAPDRGGSARRSRRRIDALADELKDADDPAGRALRVLRRAAPPRDRTAPDGVGRSPMRRVP